MASASNLQASVQKKIDELNKRAFELQSHENDLDEGFRGFMKCVDELIVVQDQLINSSKRKNQQNVKSDLQNQQQNEANFSNFHKWLKTNNVDLEAIKFGLSLGVEGNGILANRDIKADEVILRIPLNVMMTNQSAVSTSSEVSQLIGSDPLISAVPSLGLSLHLLYESQRLNSFWSPYIKILPKSFDIPLYFSIEELEELQGSPSLKEAIKLIKNTVKQYTYLYTSIKKLESKILSPTSFTFSAFRWAVGAVMTRQNQIPVDDHHAQLALIPLWDMCNHQNGKITTFFDLEGKSTYCHALTEFKKGEQIKIFYGERPNSQLLIYSGFVFKDNQFDHLLIREDLSHLDEKKLSLIKELFPNVVKNKDIELPIPKKEGIAAVLPFYRVLALNDEENSQEPSPALLKNALNERNEKVAVELLQKKCQEILSRYPTSIEDDKKLLSDPKLPYKRRICVQLRLIEKEWLSNIIANPISTSTKKKNKKKKKNNKNKPVTSEQQETKEEVESKDE